MIKTCAALLVCGAMFWMVGTAEACHATGGGCCATTVEHHMAVVHQVAVVRHRVREGPIRRWLARRPVRRALRGLSCHH